VRILIYTYGNHQMGMGHVFRMSNLAMFLKNRGHEIMFFVPDWEEGISKIHQDGWQPIPILCEKFEDAATYRRHLHNLVFDCIIVDALDVDESIMKVFREKTPLLLSFDNKGQGRVIADILFNILYKCTPTLAAPKLEINDFRYLILHPGFSKINRKKKIIPQKARKILITQGGSDTYGVVPQLIALMPGENQDIEYYVFIGPGFKHFRELHESLQKTTVKIHIIDNISDPWNLFFGMDLAISAGGMTLFELLCCGVPTIVTTREQKELETISDISKNQVIIDLQEFDMSLNRLLVSALTDLGEDFARRKLLSVNSKKFIDGRGCERISRIIENYHSKRITS